MRIPLSWLSEYVLFPPAVEELCAQLTSLGLEVNSVVRERPSFSAVLVARVLSVSPHPNADSLSVATVDDGTSKKTVVCGAKNCREGLLVAYATVGAKLGLGPDGESANILLKKAKIRGIESEGMLCAEDELGLAERSEGILELPPSFSVGEDVAGRLSDTVITVEVTPNLGHCLSMLGLARELAARYGLSLKNPLELPKLPEKSFGWSAEVPDPEKCPLYAALVVNGPFEEAPLEIRLRLKRAGIPTKGAIMDFTNYVMLSLGQPLQAFDARAFPGQKITIGYSDAPAIQLADGREVKLPNNTLAIMNEKTPCAVAGIMESLDSAVSVSTQTVVVGAALFAPSAVRKAGKAIGVLNETVRRFEYGVDPTGTHAALRLFLWLLQGHSPGAAVCGYVDCGSPGAARKAVTARRSKAEAVLGKTINEHDVEQAFARLKYDLSWIDGDRFSVSVPAYRHDVHEEIDLIEELSRPTSVAPTGPATPPPSTPSQLPDHSLCLCEQKAREVFVSLGLQECITCDLIPQALSSIVSEQPVPEHAPGSLAVPTPAPQSLLRPSLFPGLVDCLKRNLALGERSLAAFEIGTIYVRSGRTCTERLAAGVLLAGQRQPLHFSVGEAEVDFFDIKGLLDGFTEAFGISGLEVQASMLALFHSGRQASVLRDGRQVGMLGEICPAIAEALELSQRVYFMELDLQDLFEHRNRVSPLQPPAPFPSAYRDWALTVPQSLTFTKLMEMVRACSPPTMEAVSLRGLAQHEELEAKNKAVTLRCVFRDQARTLTQQEVDKAFLEMVQASSVRYLGMPLMAQTQLKGSI